MNPLDKQKLVETTKETWNKAWILKTAIIWAALLSTRIRADDLLNQCDFYKDWKAQKLTRAQIKGMGNISDQEAAKKENSCIISLEREQRTEKREQRTKRREQRTKRREKWKQRFDMTLALLPENKAKKFLKDEIENLDIKIKKEANNEIKDKLILKRKNLQERLDKLNKKIE